MWKSVAGPCGWSNMQARNNFIIYAIFRTIIDENPDICMSGICITLISVCGESRCPSLSPVVTTCHGCLSCSNIVQREQLPTQANVERPHPLINTLEMGLD